VKPYGQELERRRQRSHKTQYWVENGNANDPGIAKRLPSNRLQKNEKKPKWVDPSHRGGGTNERLARWEKGLPKAAVVGKSKRKWEIKLFRAPAQSKRSVVCVFQRRTLLGNFC